VRDRQHRDHCALVPIRRTCTGGEGRGSGTGQVLIADFFCCKNKEGGGATEEVGATGAGSIAEHAHECSDGGDIHEKNEVDGNR